MKILIPAIPLILGFILDCIIGDPYKMPHPIKLIGRLIGGLEKLVRSRMKNLRSGGVILALTVIIMSTAAPLALLIICYCLNLFLAITVETVLCCYMLAARCLRNESMKVCKAAESGNTEAARKAVSMIVGRDTEVLDETGVTKAAVETVAENFSDGVIAPMLYAAIGGPVLGLTYKAINTMDSMVGYRNDRYMWFGTAAAKLDDLVNYIPSRLSALLLIAASDVSGSDYNASRAFQIWKRDRANHKSPNAAQTESAAAGALGLQLAGDAQYFGKTVRKPFIGDKVREIEAFDIVRVNRLMTAASFIGFALCMVVIYTAASIFI